MLENIHKGVDDSRVMEGRWPYFVCYTLDGERCYEFFPLPFAMHRRFETLKRLENDQNAD